MRIGAIDPQADANQLIGLVGAIQDLQATSANVQNVYFTVESLLEED
jgi:hypothetical protein